MTEKRYLEIVHHYEQTLRSYGDNHKGVDWPRPEDVPRRYDVMLELMGPAPHGTLLDLGCGAAHLLDHIRGRGLAGVTYVGADLSQEFIALCRNKHPDTPFILVDVLENPTVLPPVDWVVMNGLFTEKRSLSFAEMDSFLREMLQAVFRIASKGMAFNVMSKQVDWERDDLFHVPLDHLAEFLCAKVSRHFAVRSDYGLYEYTTYVYKEPSWQRS